LLRYTTLQLEVFIQQFSFLANKLFGVSGGSWEIVSATIFLNGRVNVIIQLLFYKKPFLSFTFFSSVAYNKAQRAGTDGGPLRVKSIWK